MTITTGDSVTLEYTGRLADGPVFDTTRESVAEDTGLLEAHPAREFAPVTVEVGSGEIINGLEEGLVGMEEGGESTIVVPPEDGYGEPSEENVQAFETDELRDMLGETPAEGTYLETQSGHQGEITHVDDEVVRVDFNHELAGETLEFDIEIVDVR